METDNNNQSDSVIFDLKLDDNELLSLIKRPLTDSITYWDEEFKLKKVRADNMNLWLPNHYEGMGLDLYDYQESNKYQEPRVFVSVETICSVVNSRIPMPSIAPAQNTETSVQLADDVRRAMYAYSSKYQINDIFRVATRNLLLKRAAYIKLRFDESVGQHGEIVTELVLPEDVIPDKDAKWNEIPKFIAHIIRDKSFEDLATLFPDQEQAIYKLAGVQRQNKKGELVAYKSQLAKKKTVYEIWFRYVEDGKYMSGVMWVDDNFQAVLGKMKNPNWNYDEEKGVTKNILDNPEPPFISFNYLNDGSSYIDLTTIVEQAAATQKAVDKRGFQIMENADRAESGMIFNTQMISKEEVARLSGDPQEKIGVNGPVNTAISRVPVQMLPNYVVEDKIDLRAQVDDIFGTHDISRGKDSGNKTLGQDKLQVSQDYTRIDDISRAVLRSSIKYYRYLAQMMKVYYTEEHWFKAMGEDGKYDFVMMKNDIIEDGIDITVEEGSNMPMNKGEQSEFAANLAALGLIDPLTLYEVGSGMPLPQPKKMLERLMMFKTDPMAFAGLAAKDELDREALADIMILNNGELPKLRDTVTPEYLNYFTQYMLGADFQAALKRKPEIKFLYQAYLEQCQKKATEALMRYESQMPTQEELDMQAQKEAMRSQVTGQIDAGSGEVMPEQPKPTSDSANKTQNML